MATEQIHSETDKLEALKSALADFETALQTPVVSGELADWLKDAQKTWGETSARVHCQLKHDHPRQYEQISAADLEMLPRVEQLQAEDQKIEAEREALNNLLTHTAESAPRVEPDETRAAGQITSVIDAGIAFITRVRKQEVAIQTWFIEAFNRDRGSVD